MKKAFTLAEVLITLTIIGVIAALTIPNLIQKQQDHSDVQKVKQAYSILSNAVKIAVAENGPLEEWNWPDKSTDNYNYENTQFFISEFTQYLKHDKQCSAYDKDCFTYNTQKLKNVLGEDTGYKWGEKSHIAGATRLNNGMNIGFSPYTKYNNRVGVYVDINGNKGPNRLGWDTFEFMIYFNNNKVEAGAHNQAQFCNPRQAGVGLGTAGNGVSCAWWVVNKGNLDYKYRDVTDEWPSYKGNQ